MPVYEYRCKTCGKTHEIAHGFHDERPAHCPSCGGPLVRVFHPVGVVFKGSGFHKTDYSRSGVRTGAGADDGKPGAKPADSGSEKKTDANTTETKPTEKSTKPKAGDSKTSGSSTSGSS